MQNRYAGDANDFIKYFVLRHILKSSGLQICLGINWYLTDPEKVDQRNPQNDGERIGYLLNDSDWRQQADQQLYHCLQESLITQGEVDVDARSVQTIATSGVFPDHTLFFDEEVPQGKEERGKWMGDSIHSLSQVDLVFLDPDNSVSDQSQHAVRGGKWASPQEVHDYYSDQRSVCWISHPRQQNRVVHHSATLATIQELEGMLCSLYQGHCGFHFILCDQHRQVAKTLQSLAKEGHQKKWGTWRYCDTENNTINWQDDKTLAEDENGTGEECETCTDIDGWEYQDAVIINDHGNLWEKHNHWLIPDECWEVAFLLLDEERIVKVQFERFNGDSEKHGVRPFNSKENKERWEQIAGGTSKRYFKIYPGLVRQI